MSPVTAPGRARPVTPSTILAARLDVLARRLGDATGLDPALADEAARLARLAGGLDPYVERCTSPPSAALTALARDTAAHDWNTSAAGTGLEQEMLSGHVEGRFLRMLARLGRVHSVLEIGLFTGYSALALAEALPADGRLVACELDPEVAGLARQWLDRSPAGRRVEIRIGPAAATLNSLVARAERFDLVFLDADKTGYAGYLDTVLSGGLLAPGGIICVDNTLMQGLPWADGPDGGNGAAIAAFNETVAADPRVEQVLVPLRDGLTIIRSVEGDRS